MENKQTNNLKEKETMKVYLQYPWKSSDSQYYKSMIDNSPEGIEFNKTNKKVEVISKNNKFKIQNYLKKQIRYWTEKLGVIIVNSHKSPEGDYDLIHSAHCLSKNTNKPWVTDVESLWQMWISGINKKKAKEKVLKYLLSDNCKKIMAWSEFTKNEIITIFPEIEEKVEVVYYAMPEQKQVKKTSEDITLFFSGRHFLAKGGLDALEVINKLTKKYDNVKGIINGVIPKEVIKKYSKNDKIEFHQLMPYEELVKLYQRSDIFIYPGYSDSFGFGFIEAMAFGLPIVSCNTGRCRREIVRPWVNGFLVDRDSDVVQSLCDKVSLLIDSKNLRDVMTKNCLKIIKGGRFSIKKRNKKLKRIYEGAIK